MFNRYRYLLYRYGYFVAAIITGYAYLQEKEPGYQKFWIVSGVGFLGLGLCVAAIFLPHYRYLLFGGGVIGYLFGLRWNMMMIRNERNCLMAEVWSGQPPRVVVIRFL